ncbi:unnamed protein product (macronuclear) [Paramecium tetraurelia]|uniref:Uncharacterized protein n=1 Tax=Paramecium tetraurelia TaxID=5888 RepID=A0DYC6_PARTE|nr:uncharacterized protein GSPATT00003011001 [Paramecium tetraurelia]CAK88043.1 unnamed protein product [Paramecium tetraurelia]|eukprot:XP_001455440.1 hypothetical protein (macronuclear) [Paramecium tetraurelia strain d4-2]
MSDQGDQQYDDEDQYGDEEGDEEEIDFENMTDAQKKLYMEMHGQYYQEEEDEEEGGNEENEEEEGDQYQNQMNQGMGSSSQFQQDYAEESRHSPGRREQNDEYDPDEILRKVKRDLLENVNRIRREKKLNQLYIELMPAIVAERYASHLLDNDHSDAEFKKLIEFYKYNEKKLDDLKLIYIVSKFEEDTIPDAQVIYDYFMEMGYLFFEVEDDRKILLSNEMNHISIGVSCDDNQVAIVYIVSHKDLCVTKIEDSNDGSILVHGKMLEDLVGVYALQILPFTSDSGKVPDKNENNKIGPEHIEFDRQTKCFIAKIGNQGQPCTYDIRQYIDLYTRNTPESIPYKKSTREKLNLKHIELKLRIPVIFYPDPRYAHEEQEAQQSHQQEEQAQQNIQDTPIQQLDEQNSDENKDNLSQDENQKQKEDEFIHKFQMPKEQQLSNKDIKEELEIAIAEAQRQHDELYDHNVNLQSKIKQIRNKQEVYADKTGEMTMNEHKYLNTLAHVHQIRLDLQQTQDRYNQMAQELQSKLDEKSKKCNEIRQAFMDLKREVARKAAYSRTDKPIPEVRISEWEEQESAKNKTLQELRLDTLRLKNTLAKNQKQLKKKEELAEGLHLIDFEQLKIENQTLNEKIEERNEDLHKLKNKNTKTVQMLTHTREKLGYVKAKFQDQEKINQKKKDELEALRKNLGEQKESKDKLRTENLKLKQQTGIVNRPELIQDYSNRKKNIDQLKVELEQLEQKLKHMQKVIDEYQNHLKKKEQEQQNKQKVRLI